MTEKKTCLLVLGMHRSGTSALTRVLSLCGAALPKRLLGAGPGNEFGHWEPERIVAINDEMLAEVGSGWNDWQQFSFEKSSLQRREHYEQEIKQILTGEYGDSRLIVLKEPRIARFAKFYADILEGLDYQVCYLHATRHPLAVAASLGKRNGYSEDQGILLWMRHTLDAEEATRGKDRVFVSYEDLLDNPTQVADKIVKSFPAAFKNSEPMAAQVKEFVKPSLQHHRSPSNKPESFNGIQRIALDAHAALRSLEGDDKNPAAQKALDGLRARLNEAGYIAGEVVYESLVLTEKQQNEINALKANLIDARKHPVRQLVKLIAHHTLKRLSKASPPLPAPVARKFETCAAELDPNVWMSEPRVEVEARSLAVDREKNLNSND